MKEYSSSIFISQWKEDVMKIVKAKYKDKKISKKKLNKLLNKIIEDHIKNPDCTVVNNYTNKVAKSDVLSLIDLIERNKLIIGGGGCLFLPHGVKRNLIVEFILYNMEERDNSKAMRKKYEKGSFLWTVYDTEQSNTKLVINALYGVHGFPGASIYNVFIAEAITNGGRHIITSSIGIFEYFLGDAIPFTTVNELYLFISNVIEEYKREDYENKIDLSILDIDDDIYTKCINRLIKKCEFKYDDSLIRNISIIINNLSLKEVVVMYYKNNLEEFNEQPVIRNTFKYIIDNNGKPLLFCDMKLLKDDDIRDSVNSIRDLYFIFVLYNYPLFDRIRKAMYLDKTKSLYTDTDSVFVSVSSLVRYILSIIDTDNYYMSKSEVEFTGANLMFIYINIVVDKALKMLCYSTNVEKEWSKKLVMKNEYYFTRLVFMNAKKRYFGLAVLQEGSSLNNGLGLPEVKGIDFKKSTTKPFLRNYYENITMNDILRAEEIKPHVIFKKMIDLKHDIEKGIREGERKYYKQSSVKLLENYKNPYSTPGVIATMIWNTLCPQYSIDLPADIDLVPIVDLTFKKPNENSNKISLKTPLDNKNIAKFAEEYPDEYNKLYNDIYLNYNADVRHMTIKYIGIPRNDSIEIPDFVFSIINYDKIVNDSLNLFLPIMNSIGLKSLPISSNNERMSNIVEL
jgi:hypothetical protein